jgi:hypothetical protein
MMVLHVVMFADEIFAYIFDGNPHLLSQPMADWLASSRRFTVFANTFRDKIRKKIRVTQDPESILDLRVELETAYCLLQERSLSLVYEPLQAERSRSPDFAVTYTTSLTFMVEVTRLRPEQKNTLVEVQNPAPAPDNNHLVDERLADAIGSKLGQLVTQHSNVLLVGVEKLHLTDSDLRATMLHLQHRAERNDAPFLQRHRFRDRADFFRHFQRLSEVLVRAQDLHTDPLVVWVNPQTKHPLPSKVRTVLYRSHGR